MYSHRLLNDIVGLEDVEDGVVRISMLHYNSGESAPGGLWELADGLSGRNYPPGRELERNYQHSCMC
jgi:hypothetical protein